MQSSSPIGQLTRGTAHGGEAPPLPIIAARSTIGEVETADYFFWAMLSKWVELDASLEIREGQLAEKCDKKLGENEGQVS